MNSGPRKAAQPQVGLAADRDNLPDYPDDPEETDVRFDRLPEWQAQAEEEEPLELEAPIPSRGPGIGQKIGAALLILLAVVWIGAVGWSVSRQPLPTELGAILNLVALVSTPLILLAIGWLILGYSPRRRTERFAQIVARMQGESRALESVLEIVAEKLEENHARLTQETAKLMSLGDEASDRLGRVTHYISKETRNLDKQAEALEAAAANAKVDIGVLLHDLPRAEEQAKNVAASLRDAGLAAHEQAGALDGQLTALAARGREADEVVGGAAQRLGAHLARVQSTAAAATEQLDEATIGMTAAIDGAMARAAESIGQARSSLDAQGAAMLATVEQSRAAMAEAGDEAARNLGQRLERIGIKIESLAGQIATQDEAGRALVSRLGEGLSELDRRLNALHESGMGGAEKLQGSYDELRTLTQSLIGEVGNGQERIDTLRGRMGSLSRELGMLSDEVPATLERIEAQAERARAATEGIGPGVAAIETAAGGAAGKLAEVEASVTRQRETIEGLVERLAARVGEVDERLANLREGGIGGAETLYNSLGIVSNAAQQLQREIGGSEEQIGTIGTRIAAFTEALAKLAGQLDGTLPESLARIEQQAARASETAGAIAPRVSEIEAGAESAAARLAEVEVAVSRQHEAIDSLVGRIGEGTAGAHEQLRLIGAAASEADEAAAKLARDTGPQLIGALLRVREAAQQAAEHARQAIAQAIPDSAAALADASRKAVIDAVSKPVEEQMNELVKVADAAVETAKHASERLTRQLMTIGETTAAIEERFDEARREHEERESDTLARHVSLLIEALNSTAIDVTKILSNEVTDSAWNAYLKGDRGVFTRRAVRLLSSAESREILRHYEEEPDFRNHVNRYIHDFELMIRRVLADRDGSPLGVTILSSDMGKLYVALAQAIERLRQ